MGSLQVCIYILVISYFFPPTVIDCTPVYHCVPVRVIDRTPIYQSAPSLAAEYFSHPVTDRTPVCHCDPSE